MGPLVLVLILFALGCAAPGTQQLERQLVAGDLEQAAALLEAHRERAPRRADLRILLADQYYLLARRALDAGDQSGYTRLLEQAQREILVAVELEPESSDPHTMMGIVLTYQGNLDAARESFYNARRLDPLQPIAYTNIAHVMVYDGRVLPARRMLQKGRRLNAPQDEIDRIEILAAWREGDFEEARDLFRLAHGEPGFAERWDGAALPRPMESFEDFAAVCCQNPTCGPNMRGACRELEIEVETRELEAEAILEELRLEMIRKRRLREIYEQRKELEVVVEETAPTP